MSAGDHVLQQGLAALVAKRRPHRQSAHTRDANLRPATFRRKTFSAGAKLPSGHQKASRTSLTKPCGQNLATCAANAGVSSLKKKLVTSRDNLILLAEGIVEVLKQHPCRSGR